MRVFLRKIFFFTLFVFILLEITNRILIDPLYYGALDKFNVERKKTFASYHTPETKHVDYLFLGSSRIPASINPDIIMAMDINSIVVNAGRGYSTPAVQYQALKKRILKYPGFIKGSKVLIELAGSSVYTENFIENQFRVYEPVVLSYNHLSHQFLKPAQGSEVFTPDKPMPHLLLPYLNIKDFIDYLHLSNNSLSVKIEMTILYFCSSYRCASFINEKIKRFVTILSKTQNDYSIILDGGIRDDLNLIAAKQKAINVAKIDIEKQKIAPLLTEQDIDNGFIAYFNNLITKNGGRLYLFDMPLHSIQKQVFNTEKEKNNRSIFEAWAKKNNIAIIHNDKFKYSDSDFPDYWHLSKERRDEFSNLLFSELKKNKEGLRGQY